jgi:hypothetical protein
VLQRLLAGSQSEVHGHAEAKPQGIHITLSVLLGICARGFQEFV